MTTKYPRNYILTLDCGHRVPTLKPVAPALLDEWRCPKDGIRFVTQIDLPYRMRCMDCKSAKSSGMARLANEMFASKHSRANPTHTVHVMLGDRILYVISAKIRMQMLDFPVDLPPF